MMPYWASSCSSRWLYASHGQITVMSKMKKTKRRKQIMSWGVFFVFCFCFLKEEKVMSCACFGYVAIWLLFFYLPVPRPSIPGISSPKLVKKENNKLYWRTSDKLRWLVGGYQKETYPITPLLGGLLLNCRVFLCLNLGADLRGEPGAVALRGALLPVFPSGLATSKFMLLLFQL